jgi:hypothetical protein
MREKMKNEFTRIAGGTGLRPVQFGVTPNCGGARTTAFGRTNISGVQMPSVSGVTPETTGVTPVPPDFNPASPR